MTTARGGRPPHQPTDAARSQVEALAACGIREEEIARVVGVTKNTLRKYYIDELDLGGTKATATVAQSLYKMATNPNGGMKAVTAQIFWLKTRAGWRETTRQELTGKDGGPIETKEVSARDIIAGKLAGIAARGGPPSSTGDAEQPAG